MRNLSIVLLLMVALTAILATPAGAMVRNEPVQMLIVDPPVGLTPGDSHIMTLLFTTGRDVTIHDVKIDGASWDVVPLHTGEPRGMLKESELRLRFDVKSSSPVNTLAIEYSIDGVLHHFVFDPANDYSQPMQSIRKGDTPPRTTPERSIDVGEPFRPTLPLELQNPGFEIIKMEENSTKDLYRAIGQITYWRQRSLAAGDENHFIFIGVDGATVRVFDADQNAEWELASGVTDDEGYFDISFIWDVEADPDPDLFIRYESAGPAAHVHPVSLTDLYTWESPTYHNFAGGTLDFGQHGISENAEAMHVLTSVTRTHRWVVAESGADMGASLRVNWPNDRDGAYYTPGNPAIYIGPNRAWNESTHSHEYGHHIACLHIGNPAFDYCNDICDPDPPSCGHCIWCEESEVIAWMEGFPNWVANIVTLEWDNAYQHPPLYHRYSETTGECYQVGYEGYRDAFETEGFFQAFLHDLEDNVDDNDPVNYDAFDVTNYDASQILAVHMDGGFPLTARGFIEKFIDTYPEDSEIIWGTAANNGYYNLDTILPVTFPPQSSHNATPRVNSSIVVTWEEAWDDLSGIAGYSYHFSTNGPVAPSTTQMGLQSFDTEFAPGPRNAGSYYFTLRAFDREGNCDDNYQVVGPMVIEAADPGDLEPYADSNWDYPAVPRPAGDVDMEINAPTSVLPQNGTYWNINVINNGTANVPSGTVTAAMVDGIAKDFNTNGVIYAEDDYAVVNQGLGNMTGGRHTFGARADYYEILGEPNEIDNNWNKQWNWNPTLFYGNPVMNRPHPPVHDGGWDSIYSGSIFYNSDGLRFLGSDTGDLIAAVVIIADDPQKDFDLRLHDMAVDAVNGFGTNLGFSTRPERYTDAVLVNCENRPRIAYDVGVVNLGQFSYDGYYTRVHYAENVVLDTPLYKSFTAEQAMDLYKFEITAENQGPQSIQLAIDTFWNDSPVYLAWYDETFSTGTLLGYDQVAITDGEGYVQIDIDAQPGLHGLVVWRDQADGTFTARDYTITVGQPPADLVAYQPYGWDAPIIPRPALDAHGSYAPAPTYLPGDQASTYLNYAYANESLGDADDFYVSAHIDAMMCNGNSTSGLPAGSWSYRNRTNALTVSGGRHAVRLMVDYSEDIFELIEWNNFYGAQYVWSPTQLEMGTALFRDEPSEPTSDWEFITTGEPIWSICDGVRTPQFAPSNDQGYWGVVAINPTNYSDVDLRLHNISTSASNGFADALVRSSWPPEATDFIIMNFNQTNTRVFDAGVITTPQSRNQDYKIVASESSYHGASPSGTYGPFTMASDELVMLHEFNLDEATEYDVILTPVDPSHNVGLSLYGPDLAYYAKSDVFEDGAHDPAMDWDYEAAATRSITFTTSSGGYHCLAVWKSRIEGSDLAMDYSFSVIPSETSAAAQQEIPVRTQLSSLYPNPFNPQTRIVYELAAPENVRINVYDLTGRLVRNLVQGHQVAGRYESIWDGQSNSGQTMASGIYVVRLQAGSHVHSMRATLLK